MKTRKSILVLGIMSLLLVFRIDFHYLLRAFHRAERPPLPQFSQAGTERIKIFFVPGSSLAGKIGTVVERVQKNIQDAESKMEVKAPEWKIYLYNTREEKGAFVEDIRPSSVDLENHKVHCILNQEIDGLRDRPEYQILIFQKFGNPFADGWTEFAAAGYSGVWNQKTLEQWSEFLRARNLEPSFPDFFSNRNVSPYWRAPWNAIFFNFLSKHFGQEAVIRFYQSGKPPSGFEEPWKQFLNQIPSSDIERFKPSELGFQKGMSYAYSNSYDGGYATRKSKRSLDKLKALGVNAVASIPYGYMRSSQSPAIGRMGSSIIGEADEAMFELAKDARDRKMIVMLKPQIWLSHGSWPGSIDFPTRDLWEQWMKNYENWILHYAILAELSQADLFCIGTEFVNATTKHPDDWKQLIQKIRRVYHGPLTYAANYGKEFEELSFWADLDYIGLDNYYPVRKTESEDAAEIQKGFELQKERVKAVATHYGKPLIFTEIGYMANNHAGMGHLEYDGSRYDEKMQNTCYHVAMQTYWNEPWFAGMYWWKWFSDPDDAGREADSHSPHGRPAESAIKEWYTRAKK